MGPWILRIITILYRHPPEPSIAALVYELYDLTKDEIKLIASAL